MSGVRGRQADLGHQMLQFGMSSRESGRDGDGGRGRLKRSGERVAPGPAARGAQAGAGPAPGRSGGDPGSPLSPFCGSHLRISADALLH